MKLPGIFVIGTDTEVGKTYQACLAARHLSGSRTVGVYKPVASGGDPKTGDAALLREATGQDWPLERVCPQWFAKPVAPPMAAAAEGDSVDERLLESGADWWQDKCQFLIVEGAGGLLSPISSKWTVLDLVRRLNLPTVLVAANKLGVVNHTLLTLDVLKQVGLSPLAIVLNSLSDHQDASQPTNSELLGSFTRIPILSCITELVAEL